MERPVIDLHCDLLAHLLRMPEPNPFDPTGIGCSFPALAQGNVRLQVMAIFTATRPGSSALALKQSEIFKDLLVRYPNDCQLVHDLESLREVLATSRLGMVAAIENASGFCEEAEPLAKAFERLERIIQNTTRLLYIGLTHHAENRFGGGNNSKAGLKADGKTLLQYLSGRKIAVDFSHASDALAHDMLDYITAHDLEIPVMASHSNYRSVWDHVRNLPDELAQSLIQRQGLIGLNFLRAFVSNDDPNALFDHFQHGLELGGAEAVCLGADFFCTDHHPDRSRVPFYFPEHVDATRYPTFLQTIAERWSPAVADRVGSGNALQFLERVWG